METTRSLTEQGLESSKSVGVLLFGFPIDNAGLTEFWGWLGYHAKDGFFQFKDESPLFLVNDKTLGIKLYWHNMYLLL